MEEPAKLEISFDDDKLNRKKFAAKLFNIIEAGKNQSKFSKFLDENSFSISLHSEFGNGKTVFLKMLEHWLINGGRVTASGSRHEVVFIDAWKNDFIDPPILSILYALHKWAEDKGRCAKGQTGIDKKLTQLKQVSAAALKASDASLNLGGPQYGFGVKVGVNIGKAVQEYRDAIGSHKSTLFDKIRAYNTSIFHVKQAMSSYLKACNNEADAGSGTNSSNCGTTSNKTKLIILVDELDRARPDYAVRFLEDLKHFLSVEGLVVIAGVNRKQLEKSCKVIYGDIDFKQYYNKFFNYEINLPDHISSMKDFVNDLMDPLVDEIKDDNALDGDDAKKYVNFSKEGYLEELGDWIFEICRFFKPTLREVVDFTGQFKVLQTLVREDFFRSTKGRNDPVEYGAYGAFVYSFFILLSRVRKSDFDQFVGIKNKLKIELISLKKDEAEQIQKHLGKIFDDLKKKMAGTLEEGAEKVLFDKLKYYCFPKQDAFGWRFDRLSKIVDDIKENLYIEK